MSQKRLLTEINLLANLKAFLFSVIAELMKAIREQIGCLYKLAECVSMLDMLVSFANACTLSNYSKSVEYSLLSERKRQTDSQIRIKVNPFNKRVISSLPKELSIFQGLRYRNQSIYLQSKSMDWFLYDRYHRHERVKDDTVI